ncbi:hypothetical protein AXG93_2891s1490 [Marchantia polymorpha subsp. ruderalis]|uniref:Uncharacterized protein n=1 Tax=Marchantia polymorpha subsp. ruderalis TaxID=1480154 RepID=A0A176WMM8_MARPO|nr:hypothetical protein AXG93_2891s1490 [Marchantia polymorpha subsp. ruderalis]
MPVEDAGGGGAKRAGENGEGNRQADTRKADRMTLREPESRVCRKRWIDGARLSGPLWRRRGLVIEPSGSSRKKKKKRKRRRGRRRRRRKEGFCRGLQGSGDGNLRQQSRGAETEAEAREIATGMRA